RRRSDRPAAPTFYSWSAGFSRRAVLRRRNIMSRQIQDAYIVAAVRTPVGRATRGSLRGVRPDDLLVHVIRSALAELPGLDPAVIEDVLVGCAIPEGPQGMNVARIGALLAGLPQSVGGVTVNRFCASGLTTLAM